MPDVVVVAGDPHPGSETSTLARAVGTRIARARGATGLAVVDVADLGAGLFAVDGATRAALTQVQDAAVLVVATPARFGTFSGVLKAFFDHLPVNALAGVLAVPVVTADFQPQADAAEAFLARLLSELGADVVDFGLTAIGPEILDPGGLADQYAAALAL